jgi:hypothetical protein
MVGVQDTRREDAAEARTQVALCSLDGLRQFTQRHCPVLRVGRPWKAVDGAVDLDAQLESLSLAAADTRKLNAAESSTGHRVSFLSRIVAS